MTTITVETYPEQESWCAELSKARDYASKVRARIAYLMAYTDMRVDKVIRFQPVGFESAIHNARLSFYDRTLNLNASAQFENVYWRGWIKSGYKISNVAGNESRRYVERQIKQRYSSDFTRLIEKYKSVGF